jgi:hypothetical protein
LKPAVLFASALFALVAVAIPVGFDMARTNWNRVRDPAKQMPEVVQELRTNGLTPQVQELLKAAIGSKGVDMAYVTEDPELFVLGGSPQLPLQMRSAREALVLAASRPEWVGTTAREISSKFSGSIYVTGMRVQAPGAKAYGVYTVTSLGITPLWLKPQGEVWPTTAAVVLAWMAVAAWIYLDARDKGSAAPAWLLLGLLTGPVALAVWLIYSYTQGTFPAVKPKPCPGCGADVPRGAAFCVRCGHALRPACPDCRRPVEVDWAYCGACGRNLAE